MRQDVRRRYEGVLLSKVEAATQEQRFRKGLAHSVVAGPQGRPKDALVSARAEVSEIFRGIVDEAERNHAAQARARERESARAHAAPAHRLQPLTCPPLIAAAASPSPRACPPPPAPSPPPPV